MRSAALVTRSGLASTNLAPRGFCCSSIPRKIRVGVAVAAALDDLVTAAFVAAALTVDFLDLLFRFVILGSPEKPKGPVRGPIGRFEMEADSSAAADWRISLVIR